MMNRASMSSGIGAYAPRYMQTGGGVIGEVVDEVNSMTSGLDAAQGGNTSGRIPLTFEQFMANATTGPGGLIDGKTKEQAYQAYLSVFWRSPRFYRRGPRVSRRS